MKLWLVAFTVLSLLLLVILPGCGGGGEGKTSAPTFESIATFVTTATPVTTNIQTPTPTPINTGPVKAGAIAPWSGPMAMTGMLADPIISLVEKQVKDMGGILGGRE